MGSVIVTWRGSCPKRERQHQMCEFLEPIARLSHSEFRVQKPEVHHEAHLEGRILVDHRVFHEEPPQPSVLGDPDSTFRGMEIRSSYSVERPKLRLADATEVSEATVHGIAFDLFDGRGFYPSESRISFLFASSDDLPELNGQIVEVHDKAACMQSANAVLGQADWYLTRPSIHMRYYLERWMDALLGSVKYFLIPDLWFWRYTDNPGYDNLSDLFDRSSHPSLALKTCEWLGLSLSEEFEHWPDVDAEQRSFSDRAHL